MFICAYIICYYILQYIWYILMRNKETAAISVDDFL